LEIQFVDSAAFGLNDLMLMVFCLGEN